MTQSPRAGSQTVIMSKRRFRTSLSALAVISLAFLGNAALAPAQDLGPKNEPRAMSEDYNPLGWRGEDARFALDMMRQSDCAAQLSKTMLAKSSHPDMRALAQAMFKDQHHVDQSLRSQAQTLNFPLPKRDPRACEEALPVSALSGDKLDKAYLAYMAKETAAELARFDQESSRPMVPGNAHLRDFAEKTLPALRDDTETLQAAETKLSTK